MGCYISSRDALNIEDVNAAIRDLPYGYYLLVVVDINTNLVDPEVTL